jgi:hypothetical protein
MIDLGTNVVAFYTDEIAVSGGLNHLMDFEHFYQGFRSNCEFFEAFPEN